MEEAAVGPISEGHLAAPHPREQARQPQFHYTEFQRSSNCNPDCNTRGKSPRGCAPAAGDSPLVMCSKNN